MSSHEVRGSQFDTTRFEAASLQRVLLAKYKKIAIDNSSVNGARDPRYRSKSIVVVLV